MQRGMQKNLSSFDQLVWFGFFEEDSFLIYGKVVTSQLTASENTHV